MCGEKENLTHGKELAVEERSSPEVRRVMYSGGIELFTGGAFSGRLPSFLSSLVHFLLSTQGSLQSYSQF